MTKKIAIPFGTLFFFNQVKSGEKISAINTDSRQGIINASAILIPVTTTMKAATVTSPFVNGE